MNSPQGLLWRYMRLLVDFLAARFAGESAPWDRHLKA